MVYFAAIAARNKFPIAYSGFKPLEAKTYNYLITLYDPVSEETMIFRKGSVIIN